MKTYYREGCDKTGVDFDVVCDILWEDIEADFGVELSPGESVGIQVEDTDNPYTPEYGARLAGGGCAMVFSDGHVEIYTPEEFQELQESHSSLYFP